MLTKEERRELRARITRKVLAEKMASLRRASEDANTFRDKADAAGKDLDRYLDTITES